MIDANLLTFVLAGDAAVIGAVAFFVVRSRRRRAREEAAVAAAEAAAAAAAAQLVDDEEVTYPIAVHLAEAERRGYEAGIRLLREATQPPVWQYRSRRRRPNHDLSQPGTPAQRQNDERIPYDPWRPPQDLEVGD